MSSSRLFLSHSGEDAQAAQDLARRLRAIGVEVWLDVDRLEPGDPWMAKIEEALASSDAFAVYVGRSGVQGWADQEVRVALSRAVTDESFRLIPILGPNADPASLPLFLRQHQWLDLRKEIGDSQIVEQLELLLTAPARSTSLLQPNQEPFLGLRFFDEDDAFLFFGRDLEVDQLLEALGSKRLLTVVGASGSGKSSLIRAGLVPALRRGRLSRQGAWIRDWRVAVTRPAASPFEELARALPELASSLSMPEKVQLVESCAKLLATGTRGLGRCISQIVPRGSNTLVVVDQLEELFTQTDSSEERQRFIESLLALTTQTGEWPVWVVLVLRSDFFTSCWEQDGLPAAIASNLYAVQRMARSQLSEAIRMPALLADVQLEAGLEETLLEEVGDEPGNLSLLEHALAQLWDRRSEGRLTHAAYESIGRLGGALHHHAERVYGEFSEDEREIVRRIFLELTSVLDEGRETRRSVEKNELLKQGAEHQLAESVLLRLADRRLVTVLGPEDGSLETEGEAREVVEVAHEALIRRWRRLQGWLSESRADLLFERAIRRSAIDWHVLGRDAGALYRGRQLERALAWATEREFDVPGVVFEFLTAAREYAERESSLIEKDRLASVGILAAGIAHEVMTPVTGISSYAQMLLVDTPEDDPRYGLLKKLEKQTFRTSRIISSLLDFARAKPGEKEVLDLGVCVSRWLEPLQEKIEEAGVEFEWEKPTLEVLVEGRDDELMTVFNSLVLNALAALEGRGHGRVAASLCAAGDDRVELTVADNGPGIREEDLEKVFEPFYSTKLAQGGTGLGLAIAHQIVHRYGGDIRVRSVFGEGASFVVALPRAEGSGEG